jgi:hypothetical protein
MDNINYKDNVEEVIKEMEDNAKNIESFKVITEIISVQTPKVENSENGTAYVDNNLNGMGNIVSPQP